MKHLIITALMAASVGMAQTPALENCVVITTYPSTIECKPGASPATHTSNAALRNHTWTREELSARAPKWDKRIWITSMIVVAGATSFDAAASWNSREANPLLRSGNGRFEARGLSIKLGLLGGLLFPQRYISRNVDGAYKPLSFINFVTAGGYVAAGMINRR